MPIYKATLQVLVLAEADSEGQLRERINDMTLGQIGYEMDDGDWTGSRFIADIVPVPPEQVTDLLEEVGTDANFFGRLDDNDRPF
jgi:hypothetical protein